MAKANITIPDRSPLKVVDEQLFTVIPPALTVNNAAQDQWQTEVANLLASLYTTHSGEPSTGSIEITGGNGLEATVTITPNETAAFELDIVASLVV